MTLEILSDVLSRADDPHDAGVHLVAEMRELIGARCIILVEYRSPLSREDHRVVHVNPRRLRPWATSPDAAALYADARHATATRLWRATGSSLAEEMLAARGFTVSLVVPLTVGSTAVGAMLLLGLPDERHLADATTLLESLAPTLALVSRSAYQYAEKEQLADERARSLAVVSRELEAIVYAIAHDLRQPLRALDSFSYALLHDYAGQLDEEARDALRRIRVSAGRMDQLTDGLVSLARVSLREIAPVDMDLAAVATPIIDGLRLAHPERYVAFRFEGDLQARVDPGLAEIVLRHLLDNAWRYTLGTAHPEIALACNVVNGARVFSVRDNGIGFDPDDAEALFAPFRGLFAIGAPVGPSLGLATVRRAVARHGGDCWAEGSPGLGATVSWTLSHDDTLRARRDADSGLSG